MGYKSWSTGMRTGCDYWAYTTHSCFAFCLSVLKKGTMLCPIGIDAWAAH